MLHYETVEPGTLDILKKLQSLPSLQSFALLGGTSLALRFGHRKSEDIDLFSNEHFSEQKTINELEKAFSDFTLMAQDSQTIRSIIQNVKIEIISPKKEYLKPFEEIEGIRFFSLEDTLAFKMNAIETRGSKKDFYDLFESLNLFSLGEIISFYKKKFNNNDPVHLLKSIVYFEDAEQEGDPVLLKTYHWEKLKERIRTELEKYLSSIN